MKKLKESLRGVYNKIAIATTRFFIVIFRKKVVSKCGHTTYLKDVVVYDEIPRIIKINTQTPRYCHKCLQKMTIRCAWCGNPIFIGDRITINSPQETFVIPSYAIKRATYPNGLIGCTRMSCCDMIGEMIGFWMPPGKVELTEEYKNALGLIKNNHPQSL